MSGSHTRERANAATMTPLLAEMAGIVGDERVRCDAQALAGAGADQTENVPHLPDAVVSIATREELIAVVRAAARSRTPLTPRVAGTNLGGLTIPARGGLVLDLTPMRRIHDINTDDMVAVIEPGVTFGQLKEALDAITPPLTIGFPLSPPEASVTANCLLDGLGNLSLRHGTMGEWISGLEVVRADGSVVVTGAGALGVPVPFGRAPLPDLTGLFVSWQGTTGIVSRLAVQLWPAPAVRERSFILAGDRAAAGQALRELPRLDVLDDLGALSWPTGKMLLGVERPIERDPAEPEFFVYLDIGACSPELLRAKRREVERWLRGARAAGLRLEDPIDVGALVAIEPRLAPFARFPTRLDFLLDHPGGGLTWVGTYGPLSRFDAACAAGTAIMEAHGFPPTIVARPMKGGHYAVLRFIIRFDRAGEPEVERVRACNAALLDESIRHGFVMYKTPAWAVARYAERLDPGFARLAREVKTLLDPDGILNPGKWVTSGPRR